MTFVATPWVEIESKNALANALKGKDVAAHLETTDANAWGYFELPNKKIFTVGYGDFGLRPMAITTNKYFIVGIDELVAGYDKTSLEQIFVYRMPSVFHEFASLSDLLIIRDEIGFVAISMDGVERWKKLVNGPIDEFKIDGTSISGCTIDGERFSFSI